MGNERKRHVVNTTVSTLPLLALAACGGGGGGGGYGGIDYGQPNTENDNTAPTAANATISVEENATYTFAASDFNFYDADGDALASIIVSMLQDSDDGLLSLAGAAVTNQTSVTRNQLDDGDLQFTPDADETGDTYNSFMFSVNDGTQSGTDMYTLTINVSEVEGPTSFVVSVSPATSGGGNAYYFAGEEKKTFQLEEGQTYVFDWSNVTNHPLRFSTTADGTHGGGEEYTDGVTVDTVAGTTTIPVAANAPDLYYYCERHAGMGGAATTPSESNDVGGYALSVDSDETDSDGPAFYDMAPLAAAPAPASDIV